MTCVCPAGASLLHMLWNKCLDRKQKSNQSGNVWFQILVPLRNTALPQEECSFFLSPQTSSLTKCSLIPIPFLSSFCLRFYGESPEGELSPLGYRDVTANSCLAWLHQCFNLGLPAPKMKGWDPKAVSAIQWMFCWVSWWIKMSLHWVWS